MGLKKLFRRVPAISPGDAKKLSETSGEQPLLLDVREPGEYRSGHIPGAVHIPLSRLADRLGAIDPGRPVITYCKAGKRSRSAASLLLGAGFTDVRSMEGGMDAWKGLTATGTYDHGLSVATDALAPAELLGLALAFESGAGSFYQGLAVLFEGEDAAQTFRTLAHAEASHVQTIVTGAAGLGITDVQEGAGEGLMEGAVNIDEALSWCREPGRTPFEILELAMQAEVNALDLYLKMLRRDDIAPVADIFRDIVEEEKAHLRNLGALLEKSF